MEYKSYNEFIPKIKLNNYSLGSFDTFIENSRDLIKEHLNIKEFISKDDVTEFLAILPSAYRASIVKNMDNEYIGYISVYNMDLKNNMSSIILQTKIKLSKDEINDIVSSYKEFLYNDLYIFNIKDIYIFNGNEEIVEHNKFNVENKKTILIYFEDGIEEEDLKLFKEKFRYNIPKLSFQFTIKYNLEPIAIIGLSNVDWVNRRAELNLFLNKELDGDFFNSFMPINIEKYIYYLHLNGLCNISTSVSASDKLLLNVLLNSNMNFYAAIPYDSIWNNTIETKYYFEYYPNMKKVHDVKLPKNKSIPLNNTQETKELNEVLFLKNGYIASSPNFLREKFLAYIVNEHIKALQQRERFSIPLGEDKYFIQEGNGRYGISKMVRNFSYVLLNENLKYMGYCNILRGNKKSIVIDIAIVPEFQRMGLGSMLLEAFYTELLNAGYMSVTSYVFDFNEASNKLHKKYAKYVGTRNNGYYINGKFWNINVYVKSK